MEIVRIAGIDPGLRFTGYGVVNLNTETNKIWVSNAGLVKTPQKHKGLDAILYMRNLINEISCRECFDSCDHIIVEIPAAIYSKNFSSGAMIPVSVVAGCIIQAFDSEKVIPVYPRIWNKSRKKEKTKEFIEELVGPVDDWNYDDMPKAKSQLEHIIDAVGMACWYTDLNYLEE
jgi:hypothetical protein